MSIGIGQALRGKLALAKENGVKAAAEVILDASQADVPVDTGDLKRSGYTIRRGKKATIGYRDPVSVIVHENMRARHERGRAKFLENAMNSHRDEALEAIAAELRKTLG